MTKSIIVTGDTIWDFNLCQVSGGAGPNETTLPTARIEIRAGGAWYLSDLVELACSDLAGSVSLARQERPAEEPPSAGGGHNRAFHLWALGKKVIGKKEKAWRISQFLGRQVCPAISYDVAGDHPNPDLLVIDDHGFGFADRKELWPAALGEVGQPKSVVIKSFVAPDDRQLWRHVRARLADRTTIVLPVSALRAQGAAISAAQSWDLTIEEISQELQHGRLSNDLSRFRRLVVHFGLAGAACFSKTEQGLELERFLYHPDELENQWRNQRPGVVFGATSIVTAAVARHELQPETYPLFLALGRSIAAARANHEHGFGFGRKPDAKAANQKVSECLHPEQGEGPAVEPAAEYCTAFLKGLLDSQLRRSDWREKSDLLKDLTGANHEFVAAKAAEIVIWGVKKALRMAPKAKYGFFLTVDREEIERINSIRNLIVEYQNNPNDSLPLSIAVFGPPGSGKSFAIKQLSNELFGASRAVLEFNLSQFDTEEQLHTAFHQVRDESLKGKLPLVFWDEFDSEKLRWLKLFLSPMQDAEFQAGSIKHPLGRAIYVFAGGTAKTFDQFDRSRTGDESFVQAKGPDFVSRLRGYVNIKGPNPIASAESPDVDPRQTDVAYLIRRAIMLRVIAERVAPQLIDPRTGRARFDTGIVNAFLRVEKFRHGARSLTSVLTMSSLSDCRNFGIGQLPPRHLLTMHVTEDFLEHAAAIGVAPEAVEALAKAHHQAWKTQREHDGWSYGATRDDRAKTHPLLVDYEDLAEPNKEGNRETALLTGAKLSFVGYKITRAARDAKPHVFSKKELDTLQRLEHDIWLRHHLLDGYARAADTNESLRLHRSVAPFEEVSDEDKILDRVIVETIPEVLAAAGLGLVKVDD